MISSYQLHTLVFSIFASLVGPFGGFFASGFKRSIKIKDFGTLIPGHGGLLDRFDCQLLNGVFVAIYLKCFVYNEPRSKLEVLAEMLSPEQKAALIPML